MIKKFYSSYYQNKGGNNQKGLAYLKFEIVAFFFLLAVVLTFDQVKIIKKNLQARVLIPVNAQVLGETTEEAADISSIVVSPTLAADPISPTSAPQPTVIPTQVPNKNSYTIAVYGDSMVDTMGERLEYLEHALKKNYPQISFNLYNYGVGAQNVEQGLARIHSPFNYQDRHYPPLSQINPNIIILGSFAYNPFSPYNRDQHWLGLTKLIEEAKKISPNVYLMAEIAPLRADFGKGPNGVNYETDTAYTHSGHIIEQLENAVGLARTLNIPLIDVYTPSGGKKEYVNPSDGIHPSVVGHEFTAAKITETLKLD